VKIHFSTKENELLYFFKQLFNYVKTGFLEEMAPNMAPSGSDWAEIPGSENVEMLTDSSIEGFISSKDSAMIMFYAQWCGHCKSAKPEYSKAAQLLATEAPDTALGAIDCVKHKGAGAKYNVGGYPTFNYYKKGKLIGEYNQGRRASDFVEFMLKRPSSKTEL